MPALSLDHYNIYCNDLEATVRFYERYVGLTNGDGDVPLFVENRSAGALSF